MAKKLGITKRQAIRRCKWFWKPIVEEGDKYSHLDSLPLKSSKEFNSYTSRCPLCEYVNNFGEPLTSAGSIAAACKKHCPIITQRLGRSCLADFAFDYQPQEFAQMIMKLKE
jgi:hypothetical protein